MKDTIEMSIMAYGAPLLMVFLLLIFGGAVDTNDPEALKDAIVDLNAQVKSLESDLAAERQARDALRAQLIECEKGLTVATDAASKLNEAREATLSIMLEELKIVRGGWWKRHTTCAGGIGLAGNTGGVSGPFALACGFKFP